jgi:hypothetical protein
MSSPSEMTRAAPGRRPSVSATLLLAVTLGFTGFIAGAIPGLECENWREGTFRGDVCGYVDKDLSLLVGALVPFVVVAVAGFTATTSRTFFLVSLGVLDIDIELYIFCAMLV